MTAKIILCDGAVTMSQQKHAQGENAQVMALAQDIIDAQAKEIAKMKAMLKQQCDRFGRRGCQLIVINWVMVIAYARVESTANANEATGVAEAPAQVFPASCERISPLCPSNPTTVFPLAARAWKSVSPRRDTESQVCP